MNRAIEKLHRLGVKSDGLKISFRTATITETGQSQTQRSTRDRIILDSKSPTLILCDISITSPIPFQLLGSDAPTSSANENSSAPAPAPTPASSKEKAFDAAVDQLEQQLWSKVPDFHYCETEDEAEMDRMRVVYKRAGVTTIDYPPSFATRNIFQRDRYQGKEGREQEQEHDGDDDDGGDERGEEILSKLYLFQIDVGSECESLFRVHSPSDPPQVGILFGDDIDPFAFGNDDENDNENGEMNMDMEIKFPLKYVPSGVGKVSLTNRTVIHTQGQLHEQESQPQKWNDLIKLNCILDYSSYGQSKLSKVAGPAIFNRFDKCVEKAKVAMKAESSNMLRTYMIVPIIVPNKNEEASASCALEIDWGLIDRILQNDLMPYEHWKRDHSNDIGVDGCNDNEKVNKAYAKAFAFQPGSADLYVIDESTLEEGLTAKSPFPAEEFATYEECYLKKRGVELKQPHAPLIPSRKFGSSIDREIDSAKEEIVHLAPEMVMVFPLPWDLVLMNKLMRMFAFSMERNIELRFLLRRLIDLSNSRLDIVYVNVDADRPRPNSSSFSVSQTLSFLHLLEEATSTTPFMAYERLEHLGDVVLNYFVTMNYFALNSTLDLDEEDLVRERTCHS